MTPEQLAERIRTYGLWQGPDEILDELVRRLSLAETALDEIENAHRRTSGEDGWSLAEHMGEIAYDAIAKR